MLNFRLIRENTKNIYINTNLKKDVSVDFNTIIKFLKSYKINTKFNTRGEKMQIELDLQHFCCGPKGCEIEITYGEMMDAE
ncbi:hypothetical protein MARBORIA2_11410 [Methanobrevibacter arboriphilus]|jgi:hypothetical protein|uniref:Uncharacterized protein n=1 Tax=Methanobrevibacter arboriphilus TaxID=39441 RepID=A0ACA8R5I1_METAZ|nr:hypothetical protein [Methanobrevibacter arboriphilus]MCC7561374.1 hypothetical protein [Methanobrevibacter arboriphilus]BBL62809.1 hypothetical protein MarbSA_18490 [Methanobrevibacter arboriphilus]GLI12051.1 hypothetical protein MARBORIA2_11410 [Methanobrevibacter arboriphilus]